LRIFKNPKSIFKDSQESLKIQKYIKDPKFKKILFSLMEINPILIIQQELEISPILGETLTVGGCKCEWCNKIFSNTKTLKVHKETAKYCIKKRGVTDDIKIVGCKHCDEHFSSRYNAIQHQEKCVENQRSLIKTPLENEIQSLIKKINTITEAKIQNDRKLQTKIKELYHIIEEKDITIEKNRRIDEEKDKIIEEYKLKCANNDGKIEILKEMPVQQLQVKNTNIVHNNIDQKLALLPVNTIQALDEDFIRANLDKYTYDLFLQGEDGLVAFIKSLIQLKREDGVIERNLICTDWSRKSFSRLTTTELIRNSNSPKVWVKDGKAKSIKLVLDVSFPVFHQYVTECCNASSLTGNSFEIVKSAKLSAMLSSVNPASTDIKNRKELLDNIINKVKDDALL